MWKPGVKRICRAAPKTVATLALASVSTFTPIVARQSQTDAGRDPKLGIAAEPANDDAYRAGLSQFNQRNYAIAISELAKYLKSAPTTERKRLMAAKALGLSYYFLGRYAEAAGPLSEAAAGSHDDSEVTYALGMSYVRLRDSAGARNAFAILFHVKPDSPQSGLLTAKIMIREQMEDLAQAELEKITRVQVDLPEVHYLLGELAISHGDLDQAIRELQYEISINPGYSMSYYRLGDAYSRKNMWAEAERVLQNSIWLNPDFSSPYILLGKVYEQQNNLVAANSMLTKALSMDPNNATTHYLLGTVLQRLGRTAEAAKQFDLYKGLKN